MVGTPYSAFMKPPINKNHVAGVYSKQEATILGRFRGIEDGPEGLIIDHQTKLRPWSAVLVMASHPIIKQAPDLVHRSTLKKLSILNDYTPVTLTNKPDGFWMAECLAVSEEAINTGIELSHRFLPIGFGDSLITSPVDEIAPWPHRLIIFREEPRRHVSIPPWIALKAAVPLLPGLVRGKVRRRPWFWP
jgi:hypothetical protein